MTKSKIHLCSPVKTILSGTSAAALFIGLTAHAQVGVGWTEYFPTKQYHGGVSQSQRYSVSGNVEHFWVYNTDPHFSSNDSGPRSEWKINNDYSTGSQQFQGDINPENGTDAYTVFQIFGNATSGATAFQAQMRSGNGVLKRYNTEVLASGCWGNYHRVNIVHHMASGQVEAWINGSKVGTYDDGGDTAHYMKYGCYDTASATSYTGVYWRDVRFFSGGSGGSGYFEVRDRNSGKDAVVEWAATTNSARVILYTFGAAHNDQWKLTPTDSGYYQIVNRHSGLDLVVQGASTAAGAKIIQYSFGASQNDQWKPVPLSGGYYKFVNRHSGLVLDVTGAYTTNNTAFEQWTDGGGNNQQFRLIGTP